MTGAQTWTLIGGFLAITAAMHAYQAKLFGEQLRRNLAEIDLRIEELRGEVRAALASIEQRIKHLEER